MNIKLKKIGIILTFICSSACVSSPKFDSEEITYSGDFLLLKQHIQNMAHKCWYRPQPKIFKPARNVTGIDKKNYFTITVKTLNPNREFYMHRHDFRARFNNDDTLNIVTISISEEKRHKKGYTKTLKRWIKGDTACTEVT